MNNNKTLSNVKNLLNTEEYRAAIQEQSWIWNEIVPHAYEKGYCEFPTLESFLEAYKSGKKLKIEHLPPERVEKIKHLINK